MKAPELSCVPLYSTLGGNCELADLVEWFVHEMPDRVALLRSLYEAENWSELERIAHQLKGATGSYGFGALAPAATRLERTLAQHGPHEEVAAAFDELVAMCECVRAGVEK